MDKNVTITAKSAEKKALADNPYLAPVVMPVQGAARGLAAPFKMMGRIAKKVILQRRLDSSESFAGYMICVLGGTMGFTFGLSSVISSSMSVLGGIGMIAGSLAAGPIAAVAFVSVAMGVAGAAKGFGTGALKLARHVVAPKLLAAEQRAKEKELGIKALPAPEAETINLTVKITPEFDKANLEKVPAQDAPVQGIPAAVARHIKH